MIYLDPGDNFPTCQAGRLFPQSNVGIRGDIASRVSWTWDGARCGFRDSALALVDTRGTNRLGAVPTHEAIGLAARWSATKAETSSCPWREGGRGEGTGGKPRGDWGTSSGTVAPSVALPRCPYTDMAEAIPASPVCSRPHLQLDAGNREHRGCFRRPPALRGQLTISSDHAPAPRPGSARVTPSDSSCLFVANPGG